MAGQNPALYIRVAASLDELKKNLAESKSGIETTTAAMQKMAASFSGDKLIQAAHNVTAAIGGIENVSTLTRAEQDRVNATLEKALAKYEALGREAPPHMVAIAEATKKLEPPLGGAQKALGLLQGTLGTLGVGLSVGAVVNFGKSVFDSAGKIHDMASQLGISVEAAQGFKFAADQAGSSIDTVGGALTKMNQHLSTGDKATVKALSEVGIEFDRIRSMQPEDAFLAIADAIQGIPDPMKQTELAMALFGKSAGELLPAIKEGFRATSDSAAKMSADTVNSLEAAGDAWGRLADRVTIISGTLIAHAMNTSSSVTSSWTSFTMFAENAVKFGVGAAAAMADAQEQAAKAGAKNRDVNLSLAPAVHKTAEEIAAAEAAAKKLADAFNTMFDKFSGNAATGEMRTLDAVLRSMAASGKITEAQVRAIAAEAVKLASAGATLTPRLFDIVRATDAMTPGLNRAAIDFRQLGEQIDIVIPKVDDVWKKLNAPIPYGISHLKDEFAALVVRSPADMLKDVLVKTRAVGVEFGILSQSLRQLGEVSTGAFGAIVRGAGDVFEALKRASEVKNRDGTPGVGGIAAPLFDKDASSAEKWGAGISSAVTIAAGAMKVWQDVVGAASKAQGALFGAMSGAAAGAAFGPYGAAVGAAAGGLMGFISGMTAGRKAIIAFAESFDTLAFGDGFQELQQRLHESLGGVGDRFWIQLTQEIGNSDKAGALRVINQIQQSLAHAPDALAAAAGYKTIDQLKALAAEALKTYEYMRDSGKFAASAVEDAFKKASDAAVAAMDSAAGQAYNSAIKARDAAQTVLDGINSQIKTLQAAVDAEAPEEFMGVVEELQRKQLAALEEKRAKAAATVEELNAKIDDAAAAAVEAARKAAEGAGEATVVAIRDALDREVFKIHLDVDGLPEGTTVPHHGTGGYFDRPHMAVIGDRPEYITPQSSVSQLAREIRAHVGSSGGSRDAYVPMTIHLEGTRVWTGLLRAAKKEGVF